MYRFLGRVPSKPSFLFSTKMKLVPFILKQTQRNQFTLSYLQVFLNHAGKGVWKTDEPGFVNLETIRRDYCEPNGFIVIRSYIDKKAETAYLEIDAKKTNMQDFYTWEEALANPAKPECWRSFLFVHHKDQSHWWWPKDIVEAELQDLGNITSVYETIFQFFPDT